ncbi:MAG: Virion structural protein [uncultured bacterium]|nr:MAG: Virion structural protein [uncultured bacterium]
MTTSGYILTTPIPHLPRFSSLFNFIPFLVRPIDNDIDSTQRANYRLRVPMTISGVQYVAYYLKALNISNIIPTVELRNVNNGVITSASFEPTLSDLSPVPPVIDNNNLNNPNGDYLVSTAKVTFTLSSSEIQEILDACNLIYGDPRYAVINEIALCTGVDKVLSGTFGNTTSAYTEVIATQVAAFISQYHALTTNTTQVQIELDIGSVESLLV